MGSIFLMAQFAQTALGESPFTAGLQLIPYGAALFVVAPRSLPLARAMGNRGTIVLGLVLQGAGLGAMALTAQPLMSPLLLIAPMIAAGAGVALAMPITQQVILTSVTPHEIGKAAGTYSTLRQLGGAFGVAIAVAVFAAFGDRITAAHFTAGFAPAMLALAALSFAAAAGAAAIPGRARLMTVRAAAATAEG
jgi:MFS family permease